MNQILVIVMLQNKVAVCITSNKVVSYAPFCLKKEVDLDLNFIGGKNLTFYYSENCACIFNADYNITVNISGYEVRG
jgi:hypothetical protein